MSSHSLRDETERTQREVSDPDVSAWVHANAGSGKTYVLAQRVIRLMLAGVDPSRILCLTFTKAAAANMSLRVFAILSRWTASSDAKLREEIQGTGFGGTINLQDARRLFARAVETPGGLKIQTIHAFCERLLHLFPFEANVPARFEALEDEQKALLMAEAREQMLRVAVSGADTLLGRALRIVSAEVTGDGFSALLQEALAKRDTITAASSLQTGELAARLSTTFGIRADQDSAALERVLCEDGLSRDQWASVITELGNSSPKDVTLGKACSLMLAAASTTERLALLKLLFFTKDGKERAGTSLVTQRISKPVADLFAQERLRAVDLFHKLNATRTVERSVALHRLADSILATYKTLKQARGFLDFDDLIDAASKLLQRSEASWVLYKLDQGIDHVLVDEAQDTSPRQWAILKSIAGDFFAGESARVRPRTIFAVGDEKQSIFSFQGADPREFGRSKQHFKTLVEGVHQPFVDKRLNVSFRSTPPILQAVDQVFSIEEHFTGLTLERLKPDPHQAYKGRLPGLVEIWRPVGPQPQSEPEPWTMPVDAIQEFSPPAVLAARIARHVKSLIASGSRDAVHEQDGTRRPIRPGDVMILVRRRNAFFDAVIRALKREDVAVAGADRLKLMDHIAVKDLVAAGRAALLPQDDFTLACLLKSPFFGFSDEDLIRLAPLRTGSLMAELLNSTVDKDHKAAVRIGQWGAAARSLGPFRFYARILSAERGRHAMLARLGEEAGDAIDEFLRLALQSERENIASLQVFLHSLQSADVEVKRDMEAAGEAVRVMTVHASKGLEAKIVFLPDTCGAPTSHHDASLVEIDMGDELRAPVWRKGKKSDPSVVDNELDHLRNAGMEEYRRLLYVAMTRAEERLYIAGYHGVRAPVAACWYEMIQRTLASIATPVAAPWGEEEVMRIGEPALLDEIRTSSQPGQEKSAQKPGWLDTPAPPEQAPLPPVRPSHALAAADQDESRPSLDDVPLRRLALLEGDVIHALLQHLPELPEDARPAAASRYVEARAQAINPVRRETLVANAIAVLAHPGLVPLFGPGSRAEASLAGRVLIAGKREVEISGRMDRLAILENEILIADFKSGVAPAGRPPVAYVVQLALYRAALLQLFPQKAVRAFLIWTALPRVDELQGADMDQALASFRSDTSA